MTTLFAKCEIWTAPNCLQSVKDRVHYRLLFFLLFILANLESYLLRWLGVEIFYKQRKECKYFKSFISLMVQLSSADTAAKSLQSCPTLCDPIDGSPPGSAVPGILQARTLEWVAISFSNAAKWKVKVKSLSHVQLSVTPWTAAHQAPPSMGFSRQEYWSGVPLPSLTIIFYLLLKLQKLYLLRKLEWVN